MQKCSALEEVDHLVSGTDHKARTFNCWPTFISIHLNVQETVILQTKWPIKKSPFKKFFLSASWNQQKPNRSEVEKYYYFVLTQNFRRVCLINCSLSDAICCNLRKNGKRKNEIIWGEGKISTGQYYQMHMSNLQTTAQCRLIPTYR